MLSHFKKRRHSVLTRCYFNSSKCYDNCNAVLSSGPDDDKGGSPLPANLYPKAKVAPRFDPEALGGSILKRNQ